MADWILVGLGGFAGAVARYWLGGVVQAWTQSVSFPYGTLAVNVVGCLAIGMVSQLVEAYGLFSPETRTFVLIGFLGAFTTFSTFANESLNLSRAGDRFLSVANLGLHLVLGLAAVWMGRVLVNAVWR